MSALIFSLGQVQNHNEGEDRTRENQASLNMVTEPLQRDLIANLTKDLELNVEKRLMTKKNCN